MNAFRTVTLIPGLLLALLSACASQPQAPSPAESAAELQQVISDEGLHDGRGRFRETLCAVLAEHGAALPDYRSCDAALTTVGAEQGSSGEPVNLAQATGDYLFLLVPGLGWECFANWLDIQDSAPQHVANFGYDFATVSVDGLSSSTHNARQIRDFVAGLPPEQADRPLVIMGYSKGAPDILEAVASYPELAQRTVAVISLAGAVRGSPLANDASQGQANLLTRVPGSKCDKGDEGAVASLRTDVRQQWLADNPLPGNIRYYSVVTYPAQERISWGLKGSYRKLSEIDPRNDTQVPIFDQIIPGSTLVAFLNADHWAIAVPVARQHAFVGSTFVDHNDYPREAFLEALLRYVEEDLQN